MDGITEESIDDKFVDDFEQFASFTPSYVSNAPTCRFEDNSKFSPTNIQKVGFSSRVHYSFLEYFYA